MGDNKLVVVVAAVLLVLLGVVLTYQLNKRIAPANNPVAGAESRVNQPVGGEQQPAQRRAETVDREWPLSGKLITQDDVPNLPAEMQDWLADPGWNAPYITPPSAAGEAGRGDTAAQPFGAFPFELLIDAPLNADGSKYELTAQRDESGLYVDVAFHAEPAPSSVGRLPDVQACVWAFRDGTLEILDAGSDTPLLQTTHRYDVSQEYNRIFIARLLVIDSQGGRSFADSRPFEITVP